jgi:hypothetical protein
MSRLSLLQIPAAKAGPLGPQQKRFNTLLRQIEQARDTLAAWNENVGLYRQAHAQVLQPLRDELDAAFRQWLAGLDILVDQKGWTKSERRTLRELICDAAQHRLLARGDDPEIKALYDKHADVDFDTEQREMTRVMKRLAEEATGLDLGDDDIDSDEVLFARMRAGFDRQSEAEQARREARAARKAKTPAQQRREAEAQQATQSVREIYRKLASTLHPDRETDEGERAAKTELMQRVNQAYAAGDLLAMLELQLRIEQIDASHVATASDERLKHYNKVLAEQLAELKNEIRDAGMAWASEFGVGFFGEVDPRRLGEVLEQTKRTWRADLAKQQKDVRMLGDMEATRRWLKLQRKLLARSGSRLPP